MNRDKVIGIILHSAVTGFLLQAAMEGTAMPSADLWVLATYVGATIATDMYPDLPTRVRVMIGSVVASFAWSYLLHLQA